VEQYLTRYGSTSPPAPWDVTEGRGSETAWVRGAWPSRSPKFGYDEGLRESDTFGTR